jgi:hypothetical protein
MMLGLGNTGPGQMTPAMMAAGGLGGGDFAANLMSPGGSLGSPSFPTGAVRPGMDLYGLQGSGFGGNQALNASQAMQIARQAATAEQIRTMGQRRAAGLSGMPGTGLGGYPGGMGSQGSFPGTSPMTGSRVGTPGSGTLGSPDMTGRGSLQQQQMPGATVQAQLRQQQVRFLAEMVHVSPEY